MNPSKEDAHNHRFFVERIDNLAKYFHLESEKLDFVINFMYDRGWEYIESRSGFLVFKSITFGVVVKTLRKGDLFCVKNSVYIIRGHWPKYIEADNVRLHGMFLTLNPEERVKVIHVQGS